MDLRDIERRLRRLEMKKLIERPLHVWRNGPALDDVSATSASDTFALTHLYLVPINPEREIELYRVVLAARLTGAGSSKVRLALYRFLMPSQIARPRTLLDFTKIVPEHVRTLDVAYATVDTLATPQIATASSITTTTGYERVFGTLDPPIKLFPGVQYAIGFAPVDATMRFAGFESHAFSVAFRCSNQGPGNGAFPQNPRIDQITRTPMLTLLSPQGAYILGG